MIAKKDPLVAVGRNRAGEILKHGDCSPSDPGIQADTTQNAVDAPTPAGESERKPHRLWKRPGVPHRGWKCLDVCDLGDLEGACEMCGTAIRYEHRITHPYHTEMIVGCICAGKLSGDYKAARRREQRLKSRAACRDRWLTRRWRISANGNPYLKAEGIHVVVFQFTRPPFAGLWGFRVGDVWGDGRWDTSDAAKLAAFDEWWNRLHPAEAGSTEEEGR